MKIAIFDIDETITLETDFMKKYAPAFLQKNGFRAGQINEAGYCLHEVYGLKEQLMERGIPAQEAKERAEGVTNKFWNRYFLKYNRTRVRRGVAMLMDILHDYGYEIHLLSLRGKNTDLKGTGGIVRLITKGMLKRNEVSYDKLVLVQTNKEKLEYIKYYNPQMLFEDQPSILNAVPKSIQRICILSKHNENEDLQEGTICISDYEESRADIVSIMDKAVTARNRKDMKTMAVDLVQLCAKSIGKWYFLMKFKPIIYGVDNIPSNGSVIFAGNHRNNLDPVFISISSGKSIHWAALLRLFQGKESLFHANSGKLMREMSAKFITAMGALPIARPTDENNMEINLKTIKQLKNLLNMGAAVGFFPEGTINRKPEDVNILPLRSNRVFRMAKETDSYIQPFSIVWIPKELGGKNRLVIKYSKPINPYNRSSREIGELWKETVEEGIIQR